MIRLPAVLPALVVATVSLAACTSSGAAGSATPSPSVPSDRPAAEACRSVHRASEEQDLTFAPNLRAASLAVQSPDPGVKEAGMRLMVAGKEVGDLFVKNDPAVDPEPANQRLAEAQQGLLRACTELFGAPPWPWADGPIRPAAS